MKIWWTKRAQTSFDKIVEFLQEEWGLNSALNFVQKTNYFLETIKIYPTIGKPEDVKKGLRSFVLTKQTTVFYRIKNNEVIILLKFFNTRQNPAKRSI